MSLRGTAVWCVGAWIAVTSSAGAYEFRCRFVERVGNVDIELPGDLVHAEPGQTRTIRIQFGVFDDAAGPAPTGGFIGWNVGALSVGGLPSASDEQRAPGRLPPFTFSNQVNANGNPPLPGGDPFQLLSDIDATLGTQAIPWLCDSQGNVPPPPQPVIRGLNTFVSVFAFSIHPNVGAQSYSVAATGNLIAALEWRTPGFSDTLPDCGDPADPSDDVPGSITWYPDVDVPHRPFSCSLTVSIVSPGSAAALSLVAVGAARRRRRAE